MPRCYPFVRRACSIWLAYRPVVICSCDSIFSPFWKPGRNEACSLFCPIPHHAWTGGGYLAVSIALCSARLGLARSPVGVSLSGEHGKEVREWWLAGKGEMRRENLLLLRGGWRRSYEEEPGGCHKGSSRESCLVVRCLDRSAGASATPRNLRTNFVFWRSETRLVT